MFRRNTKYCLSAIPAILCRQTIGRIKYLPNRITSISKRSQSTTPKAAFAINKIQDDKYKVGKNYYGFECIKSQYISDFNMTAYIFKHEKIHCEYLHIDRNDPSNTFSINFRTTPYDSTGLPHILEHTVLCGSEKFPIRDPFFKMINRSMATFMNALTGPDYTMYPFTSMNERDFYNLQKIYLDAVFRPNLRYLDFLQEGWRLEQTDVNDTNSEFIIKGVVYNEMKGSLSENSTIMMVKCLNSLLPDHTYGNYSGGFPLEIPKLTHSKLVEFHQQYYHPSNARFFSYGNFKPDTSLKYINENYLVNFKPIETKFSEIPPQIRWTKPRNASVECRFDNMGAPIEKQHQIAIGYLMCDIGETYETFVLNVLSELMMKGPNSPFYINLIEPNISGGYNSICGYDAQLRDTIFVIGLQDIMSSDFDKIQNIIDNTIKEIVDKGFDKEHLDSVLHSIELSLKHQSTKFGLGLLYNLTPVWQHGGNIVESLQIDTYIKKLKENISKNPKYLQDKVKKHYQENQHKLILTMSPDNKYEDKCQIQEKELIATKVNNLTSTDRERILQDAHALGKSQDDGGDSINILPCLSLIDVEIGPTPDEYEELQINGTNTQICTIDTNNVSYFYGLFDAGILNREQILLLPLLTNVITQMGTVNYDFRQFDKLVTSKTSGIGFHLNITENINDISLYKIGVLFNSYCLDQNSSEMFGVISELLNNFTFNDVKRFEMLLENYLSALSVGIAQSGHLYAMQGASSLINESGQLRAILGGIDHIEYMKNLMTKCNANEIMLELQKIAKILFNKSSLKCAINCTPSHKDRIYNECGEFIGKISKNRESNDEMWSPSNIIHALEPHTENCIHNVVTMPVNFCSKSILCVPYTHPDYTTLRILGKILTSKYLVPTVREKNGAYGAGARISTDGIFSYYSYRDPNARKTLDTFDNSLEWIDKNWSKIDDQVLFESKLGVLQTTDAPIAPGSKGLENFKCGITPLIFSKQRQRILTVTLNEVYDVAQRYLSFTDNTVSAKYVLGPENATLNERQNSERWNTKYT